MRRPSSFSDRGLELPPDDGSDSVLLTADLSTLNTMILDKIEEIKRQRNEIDQINKDFEEIIVQHKSQIDEIYKSEGGAERAYLYDICQMIQSHEKLKQICQSSVSTNMLNDSIFRNNMFLVNKKNDNGAAMVTEEKPREWKPSKIDDLST